MPRILCYLDTCISPFAFKSNPNYFAFCFSFCFFPSICFMMVKILHGDTSSYSITQARNQEPSPHSLDHQLLNYLLPKQLSDLAFTLHLHKHIISHCNTAVVSLLPPPLLPVSYFSVAKTTSCLCFCFVLPHFPAYIAAGCDHVTKLWPMGGK